ncbi:MAG: radical SAM protein [Oligoflexia bacterium]|nr:radical SAM protein [Oligoflexia bacterium]
MMNFPLFRNINIELSSACNFDCVYCPEHKMTRKKCFINTDICLKIIDEIKDINLTEEINFYHMGESLLHKDAIKILRYTHDKGLRIKLNTNGSLLDQNMRKELLSIGIEKLYISYHDSYVKHKKYVSKAPIIDHSIWHDNICSIIREKFSHSSNTNITIILFRTVLKDEQVDGIKVLDNKKDVEDAIENWLSLGKELSSCYGLEFLHGKDVGFSKQIIHYFFKRSDKVFPVIPGFNINLVKVHTWNNDIVSSEIKSKKKFKLARYGSCDALRDSMAIFADGSYSLCCADWNGNVVIGHIEKEPLKEFMLSSKVKNIQSSFSNGKLPFDYCKMCRGGFTWKRWLFNQMHSYIYYNSSLYRRVRRTFNMQ